MVTVYEAILLQLRNQALAGKMVAIKKVEEEVKSLKLSDEEKKEGLTFVIEY